jgi:hypothetical protein
MAAVISSILRAANGVSAKIELFEARNLYLMLLIISSSWIVGGTV